MPTPAQSVKLSGGVSGTTGWNWEDHVASSLVDSNNDVQNISVQDFVEAGTVLIAAAPADVSDSQTFRAIPIGLIESAVVAHNKPLNRIFEIGSKISYIVPGRGLGNMQISRCFFDGDSLLKALYWGEVIGYNEANGTYNAAFASDPANANSTSINYTPFSNKPWSKRVAIDLINTFFDRPFGLVFYFCDNNKDTLGIMYFQGCLCSSHSVGITAAANVLTEGVSIDFIRAKSVAITGEDNVFELGNSASENVFSGFNPTSNSGPTALI